jgi:hypothetical protein
MAEEKETVPNINWGSTQPIAPAGGPNSISASIQDRQAVADAFAGVARAPNGICKLETEVRRKRPFGASK